MVKRKKIILTGVTDTRNNGCWIMVNALIESILTASKDPVEFVYLISGENRDEERLARPGLRFITVPWVKINIPKVRRLIMELCFVLMPLLAVIGRYSAGFLCLGSFLREMYSADVVVDLSGDSYSVDYGNFSVRLLIIPLIIARVLRIPYIFCAQSIGTFDESFTFKKLKALLRKAALITVREKITKKYLAQYGIRDNVFFTSDLAFLQSSCQLSRIEEIALDEGIDSKEKYVGISASSLVSKYLLIRDVSTEQKRQMLIELISSIADYIVEKYGFKVIFIPHVTIPNRNDDRDILGKIRAFMKHPDSSIVLKKIYLGSELKGLIGLCDVFIGTRMHATLSALSQYIPTLTYVYNHKTIGINGEQLGQQNFLIDLRKVPVADLTELSKRKINQLFDEKDNIRYKLVDVMQEVKGRSQLNARYILGMISGVEPLKHASNIDDCTGCGTCAGVCPKKAIAMRVNSQGVYRPVLVGECIGCKLCVDVCPIQGMNLREQEKFFFPNLPVDHELGAVVACYAGYATEDKLRHCASSGGLVTAITKYLLQQKKVDAVLVVGDDPKNPIAPKGYWALNAEDVTRSKGSKYVPVPLNMAFRRVPPHVKTIATVGLPCHIWGMRLMEKRRILEGLTIAYSLALFCGKTPNFKANEFLIDNFGQKANSIKSIQYRGDGWPGKVKVKARENYYEIPYLNIWGNVLGSPYFTPYHCQRCPEFFGCLSDISFGDAWLPRYEGNEEGWSICIARSDKGKALLQAIEVSGEIFLEKIEKETIKQAFADNIKRKMSLNKVKERVFHSSYAVSYHYSPVKDQTVRDFLYEAISRVLSKVGSAKVLRDNLLAFPPTYFMKIFHKILYKLS